MDNESTIESVKITGLENEIKRLKVNLDKIRANNNSFLYTALRNSQAEFPIISRGGKSFGNQRFASLPDMVRATREILTRHGLSVSFGTDWDSEAGEFLVVQLAHVSGQVIGRTKKLPSIANAEKLSHMDRLKEEGKAISFFSRYAYAAILGLATEDSE